MSVGRRRILVVEDSLLIVSLIEEVCRILDYEIVGPAGTLAEALRLAREAQFDLAVLDINLHDELVFPVADELVTRAKPFFFSSGYGVAGVVPERFSEHEMLAKPYEIEALMAMLEKTAARVEMSPVGSRSGRH